MKNWLKIGLSLGAFTLIFGFVAILWRPAKDFADVTFSQNNRQVLTMKCEVAQTNKSRQIGLMYRESLSKDQCLLFVFDEAKQHAMWMKNMKFPIDIIFLDQGKKITKLHENVPPCGSLPCPTYASGEASLFAIEISAGLISKYQLTSESRVTF